MHDLRGRVDHGPHLQVADEVARLLLREVAGAGAVVPADRRLQPLDEAVRRALAEVLHHLLGRVHPAQVQRLRVFLGCLGWGLGIFVKFG